MAAPILLNAPATNPGYEVWQVEAAPTDSGPWRPVNAGGSGSPLRAAFEPADRFWRVVWTAYSGAIQLGAAQPVPGAPIGQASNNVLRLVP